MIGRAITGGILWSGLVAASILGLLRLGTIELLFLLAPLIVTPLGLGLIVQLESVKTSDPPISVARWVQVPATLCVIASFWLTPGMRATILTLPWFCFGCFLGFWGLARLARGGYQHLRTICVIMSFLYLPIGCAWLVASRAGLSPMNFQEPIVLLTAVHFHFAGFAAPLLAAATVAKFEKASEPTRNILNVATAGVLIGPGMLAAGFVIGPHLKLAAALLIACSEIGLAFFFLAAVRAMRPPLAQVFVAFSAASVLVAMVFAGTWAIGEFPLQPLVNLTEMTRFHGIANALGFTVCGLLGWTISVRRAEHVMGDAQ
jgi:hypothetical protein